MSRVADNFLGTSREGTNQRRTAITLLSSIGRRCVPEIVQKNRVPLARMQGVQGTGNRATQRATRTRTSVAKERRRARLQGPEVGAARVLPQQTPDEQ